MSAKVFVAEQSETAARTETFGVRTGSIGLRTGMSEIAAMLRHEPAAIRPDIRENPGPAGRRRLGSNERGQAMTEYLFLVVLCGLVCIPVVKLLPEAVRGYIRPFYYCISRPIP